MIRKIILAFLVLLTPAISQAKEYGHYDINRIRTIAEAQSGKRYAIDKNYLDEILHDLGSHARNYPPEFDTQKDQERAIKDAIVISGILNAVAQEPKPDTELFLRAGFLGIIGKNLNIPGSAASADANFKKLLVTSPSNSEGNYLYGIFLAGEGKPKKAVPYLKKAVAAGVSDAAYTLGLVYMALGNKQKALDSIEVFRKSSPYNAESADKLIDEIKKGKAVVKKSKK